MYVLAVLILVSGTFGRAGGPTADNAREFGMTNRIPWNTSRITGRPEPPLPYRARRVFPNLGFQGPTVLTSAPGTERLFVAEQTGMIYSIPDDPDCAEPDPFLNVQQLVDQLNDRRAKPDQVRLIAVYGLTFHPQFAENRRCYVCYVVSWRDGSRGRNPDGTRVVQLQVTEDDPPRALVDSEVEIITWLDSGHNGGCLKFGLDGMLYVSTGDGGFAFPPDERNSGQDVSNLLSTVFRIDVDRPGSDGLAYSIPDDNPFVSLEGARGEIWAYGMRNPWKMSFDRETGELWVGDVGWELWELVYRVEPGANYGWSLVEGRQPVHVERERGPTPIVPPTVEIPHTDGASITGGFVYRGKQFPDLQGKYIFGDWETRRIWGAQVYDDSVGPYEELVEPTVRIVGFAERNNGELLLLDHDYGSIHELEPNPVDSSQAPFPRRLSETGLFASMADHRVTPGVIPFSINALQWADHAAGERFLGLPGSSSIGLHDKAEAVTGSMFLRAMDFPKDAVLGKTLSLELIRGDVSSSRRIETQILHFNGYDWKGYSYRWNDEQTDAELVDAQGMTVPIEVIDADSPGGKRLHQWRFTSRMECIRCHNPWAESALAFNIPQLNRDHAYSGAGTSNTVDNQVRALRHIGVFKDITPEPDPENPYAVVLTPSPAEELPRLADPADESADLDRRARAYLHVNCAHCHRYNGGGSARIYLPFDTPISQTEALGTRPTQGTFGIHDAKILAAGDPYRSVLYYRMAKSGPGHMPRIGANLIDEQGLTLVHDWIRRLPVHVDLDTKLDQLAALDEPTVLAREQEAAARTRWQIARQIAEQNDRDTISDEDHAAAKEQATLEAAERAAAREKQRTELTAELLSGMSEAMMLAKACREGRLPAAIRELVIHSSTKVTNPTIRDLFEPFLPEDQRSERLGDSIRPDELLALEGNARRGRELFLTGRNLQCRNCHKLHGQGKELGPDLSQVGKKLDPGKLLESILEPSKTIDPKYQVWLIETDAGQVFSGLLVSRDDEQVVLRDNQAKELTFDTSEVEGMYPQRKSMMPDLLLREMTAQQVADLLSWLASLK